MSEALILLVIGMGTVFILLYVINVMIIVLGKLLGPKGAAPAGAGISETGIMAVDGGTGGQDEEELAVLFTAAVAACLSIDPGRVRLVVRPVETSEVWSQAGRLENIL